MKIEIYMTKDADPKPRFAQLEIDEEMLGLAVVPTSYLMGTVGVAIEALLKLDPADAG